MSITTVAVGAARPGRTAPQEGSDRRRGGPSPRGAAPWRGAVLGPVVAVALVVPALGGCSASPPLRTSGAPSVDDGQARVTALPVLQGLGRQLRDEVDRAVAPYKGQSKVIVDRAGPCQVSMRTTWPQRWAYTVHVTLGSGSTAAAARATAGLLKGRGWTLSDNGGPGEVFDVTAAKDGSTVHVVGGSTAGTLTVDGYTGCVDAQGQVLA